MVLAGCVTLSAAAAAPDRQRHKVARDLQQTVDAPRTRGDQRWVRERNGRRFVDAVIVSNSEDPELKALRAAVEGLGGTVYARFASVRALSVSFLSKAMKAIELRDDVDSVSPNRVAQRSASTLELNTGSVTGNVRIVGLLGAVSGLDGSGVGIAVLDSGIMAQHNAFKDVNGTSRVQRSVNLVGVGSTALGAASLASGSAARLAFENSINNNTARDPDPYGHGTHVAAVAAGRNPNLLLDAGGVAPGAKLFDVRVLGNQVTGSMSDVLAGIDWVIYNARQYNIRVMNLSLAADSTESWETDPLARAVRSASASGIPVVVSAGNFGGSSTGKKVFGSIGSPGNDPTVITVGSSHMQGTTARSDDSVNLFSSRGPTRGGSDLANGQRAVDNLLKPDLVAPGNRIVSAGATSVSLPAGQWNLLASQNPSLLAGLANVQSYGQTLMTLSGTSVAAPVVAGAAALLLQANPGLTPPMVKAILQYSAQPLPGASLVGQGAGLLNVDGAVRLARALKTDTAYRPLMGTIVSGDVINAAVLPTPSSSINGQSFNWSRVVFVGGRQIATGATLFTKFQPIWDPRLVWSGSTVRRQQINWWPASSTVAALSVPQTIVESNAPNLPLLTGGVVFGSSLVGTQGVFMATDALSASLLAGSGVLLSEGVLLNESTLPGAP